MEEALNQEELKQELPSEEDQSSGILPTKLTQEQDQEPFLDAQEAGQAMLDEAAQEAALSEPNLTQDLRLDDTTSPPPITTDGLGALFLSPEAAAPRDTSRNFEETTPGSLRPTTRPLQDLADRGYQSRFYQGQTDPSQPQPGYQPTSKNAGFSSWSTHSGFEPTRPSTRYGQDDDHEPDPDLAGAPQFPPYPPQDERFPESDRDPTRFFTGTNQAGPGAADWSQQSSGLWEEPTARRDFAAGPEEAYPVFNNPGGNAADLITCTKGVYSRTNQVCEVPVYRLCATLNVAETNPEFYVHYKKPHTAQHALEAITRITSNKNAVTSFQKASGNCGRKMRNEFDKFVSTIGCGQGLEVGLTVCIVALVLTYDRKAPKYSRVQDTTQAWLMCATGELDWLLEQLTKGSIPPADLHTAIPVDCPGMLRLTTDTIQKQGAWYLHYYKCVYATCCYSSQSEKSSLSVIGEWLKTQDYKQKYNEEFMFCCDRERQLFVDIIEVCRETGMLGQIPDVPSRIMNFQKVVLPSLFNATEKRLKFFDYCMINMTFEGVVQALFENERRLAEMTVQEHQLAIHSVPSQRSRRFEKDSDGKQVSWTDKRQTARDTRASNSSARDTRPARDSRPTNNARPSRAQNQPQQKGGGCANHPMALHGPEGCRVADQQGNCYRYLAKGNCDFSGAGGCRFKHSAAARTPVRIQEAKDKLAAAEKQREQHQRAPRGFPIATDTEVESEKVSPARQPMRSFPISLDVTLNAAESVATSEYSTDAAAEDKDAAETLHAMPSTPHKIAVPPENQYHDSPVSLTTFPACIPTNNSAHCIDTPLMAPNQTCAS